MEKKQHTGIEAKMETTKKKKLHRHADVCRLVE